MGAEPDGRARFDLIAIVVVVLILLPPLPPRFRVIEFAVAAAIVLGALAAFPRLRAACQRWLASLGIA
jgi:hypothetical protein